MREGGERLSSRPGPVEAWEGRRVEWRSDETGIVEGARQRLFTVGASGRAVPGVLWTPTAGGGPFPLVLIGHGGGGHKLDESRLDLAHRYTSRGVAAAAIDGPWHGERAPSAGTERERFTEATVNAMVADWRTTLDALAALPEIDAGRIGYGGVSMGTMFGLPLVAAEQRIRAAVLGLCGFRRVDGSRLEIAARLERDAGAVRCPIFYLLQWDDDLFERGGALELFDRLGSAEKQLVANPGRHHETPEHARAASTAFLVEQLTERVD